MSLLLSLMTWNLAAAENDPSPDGMLSFDSRWEFSSLLGWRPANAEPAEVNPPRFSWPAVPSIQPVKPYIRNRVYYIPYEFVIHLSKDPTFPEGKQRIEKRTKVNFENSFSVLEEGTWFWRVGYAEAEAEPFTWSAARSFVISADTPALDRSGIAHAVENLSKLPRPRLGPKNGDWIALRETLEADPTTALVIANVMTRAQKVLRSDWWNQFPESDSAEHLESAQEKNKFMLKLRSIGSDLTIMALAHRLTGEEKYAPVYAYALKAALFPPGGETSPEFNGSMAKWGTRWTANLATIYDLGWHEYTSEQREQFREGLRWRIDAIFNQKASWYDKEIDGIHVNGIAGGSVSHPYENSQVGSVAVLLMAGELPVADQLTPLVLNYLLGVGGGHGPDGAWNEGGDYIYGKTAHMLDHALVADHLLPDLCVSQQPYFRNLGDFLIQFTPPGMKRQGFGDNWGKELSNKNSPDRLSIFAGTLHQIVALTGSPTARRTLDDLTGAGIKTYSETAPVPLFAAYTNQHPELSPSESAAVPPVQYLKEPGWFFVSNESPSDRAKAGDAVRLITLARPRGGYGHSYSHDGAYVWQAYGTTLSAGGGVSVYEDRYSRSSFSHNGILVDGRGAVPRSDLSPNPISARPLYWIHDPATNTTRWGADLTGSYLVPVQSEEERERTLKIDQPVDFGAPGLQRWIRHYILANGRDVVIIDDLAMREGAAPARFTWLHHVPAAVSVESDESTDLRACYVIDGVEASVLQAASVVVKTQHLRGFDTLTNPITKTDYLARTKKSFASKAKRDLTPDDISGELILRTTDPVKEARFVTVLTARSKTDPEIPEITVDPKEIHIVRAKESVTISLDGASQDRMSIPVTEARHFAESSDPYRLPSSGPVENLRLSDSESLSVEWLRKDDFSDASWVNRWWVENQSSALWANPGSGLEVRFDPKGPKKGGGTNLWLRADAPDRLAARIIVSTGSSKDNHCNLNLLLRGRAGSQRGLVFGSRSGAYKELQVQPNYIITITPEWSRLRRDPGFTMVSESTAHSEVGKDYELLYLVDQGRIRAWMNGQPLHDWTDKKPLPNGKFGFRTWKSDLTIHSIEIGRIKS